jgi:deferrochelatase/peroxidase EfeB
LEPIDKPPGFQVGLNFVSFQNRPQKIMKMLTSQGWLGRSMTDEYKKINGLEKYISARAAGIFLIPPINKNELFPGSIMFL